MVSVLILDLVLLAIAVFGPLRWAFIAYLLLSTIDFPGEKTAVGMLNTAKGLIVPLYLMWRLRDYSGHRTPIAAPIAWMALIAYTGIAAFWSIFPLSALKMVGHMAGLLLICLVLARATKGGFLSTESIVPLILGSIALGGLRLFLAPHWADEPDRFTSFTTAQGFAAFLSSLFCFALCSRAMRTSVRICMCSILMLALLFNGSRIWFAGILVAILLAFVIAEFRPWVKICGVGFATVAVTLLVWERSALIGVLRDDAQSNRIAAAITALYEGDTTSTGLGTLNFRRGIDAAGIARIEDSSVLELIFGHGTSNGAVITGSLYKSYSGYADPNRMMHDDWLRIFYEWGLVGFALWCTFVGSIALFAYEGVRLDRNGNAAPLLVYLPAFLIAFAGENFLAGAGSAATNGLLLSIAFATISHRRVSARQFPGVARLRGAPPQELSAGVARW